MNTEHTRRSFLRKSALIPAGLAVSGIEHANAMLAQHAGEVKVTEVKAYAVRRATFAKVVASDGTTGWGECGHSGERLVAEVVNRELRELVIGRDVFDQDPTWARMYFEVDELGPSGLASQAIAGVDCALWDLRGKLLKMPLWKLLGGKHRDRIPLYGSFSRDKGNGQFMTPAECAVKALELTSEGFRAIKVRMGIREEQADPEPDPAIPAIREIRKAVGDSIELYVDANNCYTAKRAISIGKRLAEEFGVALFEEPVAAYQYGPLSEVCAELDIPVSAGEHEYTKWQFRDLILQGRVSVINPDVSKMAGLTEAMKVSALAEVFDVPISVHNARPTLLTAAHLHYCAASSMARRSQEHPGARRLKELWDYFENTIEIKDGFAAVPDLPGLGLIPRESAIQKAVVQ